MSRKEKLSAFMDKYDGVSFNKSNIPLILENLQKAENDGCLRKFLMNTKPYRSAFTFFVFNENQKAARGKDQVALVFALNLYGAQCPGFAARLNTLLKELASGSSKEAQSVMVLMAAQMELQKSEISLINFVDRELLLKVNKAIRRLKGPNLALSLLFLFGGAIGMPGFTMLGLFPLTFVSIGLFIYSFMKIPYWLGIRPFAEDALNDALRPVGEAE